MAERKTPKRKAGKPAKKATRQPAAKRQAKADAKPKKAANAKPAKPPRKSAAVERMLQAILGQGRDKATGRFKPGHRFWEARATSGPAPKFADAQSLWKACVEYFQWVEDNPLLEAQLVTFQGLANQVEVAKMRAMTISGLCLFLDISHRTWNEWKEPKDKGGRPDLMPAIERAEAVMRTQKFSGAAAGLLNPNIIARDLGLADKTELTGAGGGPVKTEDVTPQRPDGERLAEILARYEAGSPRANGHAHGAGNGTRTGTGKAAGSQ
jgi:hypothetical protein